MEFHLQFCIATEFTKFAVEFVKFCYGKLWALITISIIIITSFHTNCNVKEQINL